MLTECRSKDAAGARVKLRKSGLCYISKLLESEKELALDKVLNFSRDRICEILVDLDCDTENDASISVKDKNRFADIVTGVMARDMQYKQPYLNPHAYFSFFADDEAGSWRLDQRCRECAFFAKLEINANVDDEGQTVRKRKRGSDAVHLFSFLVLSIYGIRSWTTLDKFQTNLFSDCVCYIRTSFT